MDADKESTSDSDGSYSDDDEIADPDYIPPNGDSDSDDSDGDDGDADDEKPVMRSPAPLVVYFSTGPPQAPRRKKQKVETDEASFLNGLNDIEWEYWQRLPAQEKAVMLAHAKTTTSASDVREAIPLRFRVLRSDMDPNVKKLIISKIDNFNAMREGSGEYNKLRMWLNAVSRLPLGIYKEMPVKPSDTQGSIAGFIQNARNTLNDTVYGHNEVKDQIMRIMAQWVSNPSSQGHVIGLQGMPGVGKTLIVKQGIAKALDLPFAFVALGGASDGSFLEGHGFTYEGSTYGKIADILMKAGSMNPVIFFDELDKVSTSSRGDEIIGILTHLTDPSQNERFCDKYFSELELDLSKALIIFSYNDENLINPILKDRMITINVPGYTKNERTTIAREYLLPDILSQYNLKPTDVIMSDDVLNSIMNVMPSERCGVRSLKRALESIISWINMNRYMPDNKTGMLVTLPVEITEREVKKYMVIDKSNDTCPAEHMYL